MTDPPPDEDEAARDMEEVARAVTSGPACRKCGFPMEPGFLVVLSGEPLTTRLSWNDPGPHPDRPGPSVETLAWGPAGGSHALKGSRCPECGRLELEYGARPPTPG